MQGTREDGRGEGRGEGGRGGWRGGGGEGEGGREGGKRLQGGHYEFLVHAEQNLQPCVHWIVLAEIQRRRSALTEWFPSNKPENKKYLLLLTTKYLTAGY